jgi:UDP-N-acetylglucosamine 2-epimerase (non-hydrolysing)
MTKTICTITGIRPDFIRMRNVFKELDAHFEHVMIHTGQHYDDELSAVFFRELAIRKPDYTLATGVSSRTQYEQLAYLAKAVPELLVRQKIKPDIILFLGDSHSAVVSVPLFKEGYRIGHIEGGMRSYDRRMPEEVNRVVCDYVSDLIFVYTPLYKDRLIRENKHPDAIFVVGNTIREVVEEFMPRGPKRRDWIVADIHRNENLRTRQQYKHILAYLDKVGATTGLPVKLVRYNRALKLMGTEAAFHKYKHIELVGPYGFLDYLALQYHAFGIISDSGTAQEEGPLLEVPVAVPRKSTERPESMENGNSILVGEDEPIDDMLTKTINFFQSYTITSEQKAWLGDGQTSKRIVQILQEKLEA